MNRREMHKLRGSRHVYMFVLWKAPNGNDMRKRLRSSSRPNNPILAARYYPETLGEKRREREIC